MVNITITICIGVGLQHRSKNKKVRNHENPAVNKNANIEFGPFWVIYIPSYFTMYVWFGYNEPDIDLHISHKQMYLRITKT